MFRLGDSRTKSIRRPKVLDVAMVVLEGMLPGKGEPVWAYTTCPKDFTVVVKLLSGLGYNPTRDGLILQQDTLLLP